MAEAGFPGKTTVKLLPSPDDFRLTFDQAKFTFAGQAKFTLRVDEDYQLIDAFDTECSGSLTGSAELNYTGKSVGGNPSSAIFVGPIVSTGSATAPFQCPDAAGAFSGSDINPQGDITLTLQGFSPYMQVGEGGNCRFDVLDRIAGLLISFQPTCTYRIEEVK